jgi:hypothetical protein
MTYISHITSSPFTHRQVFKGVHKPGTVRSAHLPTEHLINGKKVMGFSGKVPQAAVQMTPVTLSISKNTGSIQLTNNNSQLRLSSTGVMRGI